MTKFWEDRDKGKLYNTEEQNTEVGQEQCYHLAKLMKGLRIDSPCNYQNPKQLRS